MRLVSLCPSLTELVFDLGRGEDLVGITRYCVHPAERVGAVEQVGGTKDPDVARIVALAPDLVLVSEEENRLADVEALRAAGLACHDCMPSTIAGTAEMVRRVGGLLEHDDAAERIAAEIESRAARVRARAGGERLVRWVYLIWRKPYMTVNAETYIDAMLSLPGGQNVFGPHATRYPEVSARDLALADPDLLLLATEPFHFQERHADELAAETGIPRERIRIVDGEYLSWYGSRTPAGIDYVEKVIRG